LFLFFQTDDTELKKLVYLYIINYAKSQPDLAILAVNTFVKVCVTQQQTHDTALISHVGVAFIFLFSLSPPSPLFLALPSTAISESLFIS